MRRLFGIALFLLPSAFASCSDGGDDSLAQACKVVVDNCKRGRSVGECVDDLAPLASDCIGCIASHACDYAACQADIPGCRIPENLLDPKDRIEVDASVPKTGPADSGSDG
jgi:hypothetical protein